MERKLLKRRLKGVLAMLLAFFMAVGNPLLAEAANLELDDLTMGQTVEEV